MSQRSSRSLSIVPRVGGPMSPWLMAVLLGVFVVLQAGLPALHAVHHAAHRMMGEPAAGSVCDVGADACAPDSAHRSGASAARQEERHDGPAQSDDCDECKTLLLAKSIGGVFVSIAEVSVGTRVERLDVPCGVHVALARFDDGLAARGPPARRF